jgi:hypothetical protein
MKEACGSSGWLRRAQRPGGCKLGPSGEQLAVPGQAWSPHFVYGPDVQTMYSAEDDALTTTPHARCADQARSRPLHADRECCPRHLVAALRQSTPSHASPACVKENDAPMC